MKITRPLPALLACFLLAGCSTDPVDGLRARVKRADAALLQFSPDTGTSPGMRLEDTASLHLLHSLADTTPSELVSCPMLGNVRFLHGDSTLIACDLSLSPSCACASFLYEGTTYSFALNPAQRAWLTGKQEARAHIQPWLPLTGCWQVLREDGKLQYEEWTDRGGELQGRGYRVEGHDTVISENIRLAFNADGICEYIPDVAGPQGPVPFTRQEILPGTWSFVNPAHDYPQRIDYRLSPAQDTLYAAIMLADGSEPYGFTMVRRK